MTNFEVEFSEESLFQLRGLDKETKKELVQARQEIKEGKYHTLEEVKKELGF